MSWPGNQLSSRVIAVIFDVSNEASFKRNEVSSVVSPTLIGTAVGIPNDEMFVGTAHVKHKAALTTFDLSVRTESPQLIRSGRYTFLSPHNDRSSWSTTLALNVQDQPVFSRTNEKSVGQELQKPLLVGSAMAIPDNDISTGATIFIGDIENFVVALRSEEIMVVECPTLIGSSMWSKDDHILETIRNVQH